MGHIKLFLSFATTFGIICFAGAASAACVPQNLGNGRTIGCSVAPVQTPQPVGPTHFTYTGTAKPVVYEPQPIKPLPRSPAANAGRASYCAKNPGKCGEY